MPVNSNIVDRHEAYLLFKDENPLRRRNQLTKQIMIQIREAGTRMQSNNIPTQNFLTIKRDKANGNSADARFASTAEFFNVNPSVSFAFL